jgi:aspartyl protease
MKPKAITLQSIHFTNVPLLAIGFVLLSAGSFQLRAAAPEGRIWVSGKIRDTPVNLLLDTGTEAPFLWQSTVDKLKLVIDAPAPTTTPLPNKINATLTKKYRLDLWGVSQKTFFAVVQIPPDMLDDGEADGILGWPNLARSITAVDAYHCSAVPLKSVPKLNAEWHRTRILRGCDTLVLEMPNVHGSTTRLIVDTGTRAGVELPPSQWAAWRGTHKHNPLTMKLYYNPVEGLVASEESWAEEIRIGSLSLTNVPVLESKITNYSICDRPVDAVLGMAALRQLDVILDGAHGYFHWRTKLTQPIVYGHNRLGAVWIRDQKINGFKLVVADDSPAYQAGIRNDDVLVKITEANSKPVHSRTAEFKGSPSGTVLTLTLKRSGKQFETHVTLKDILGPTVSDSATPQAPKR